MVDNNETGWISTQEAAKRLGLSVRRVQQLDLVLKPQRLDGGTGPRIYDPAKVEALREIREKIGCKPELD